MHSLDYNPSSQNPAPPTCMDPVLLVSHLSLEAGQGLCPLSWARQWGVLIAQDRAKLLLFEDVGGRRRLQRAVGLIRQSGVPRGARRQPRRPLLSRRGDFIKRR